MAQISSAQVDFGLQRIPDVRPQWSGRFDVAKLTGLEEDQLLKWSYGCQPKNRGVSPQIIH